MLAGAYSKTYQYLEKQRIEQIKQLKTDEVGDTVARAKKLSVETNKRRKAQATKRKIEQQREEKRRQHILTKRREEQREATEKYQRSHVPSRPPSGRPTSSRKNAPSPSRTLDETLRLVRGNSSLQRQNSAGSTGNHSSPRQVYNDALNRPYFNKYSNFHSPVIQNDRTRVSSSQNKLHNRSLKNFNNSKSLFEQKLEQQQQQLIDQQKRAFNEFNEAVLKEINEGENDADDSVSLSSADSLDESQDSMQRTLPGSSQQNNHFRNEEVINTKSSLQDTHQSVRDISFHLNSAYGQNHFVGHQERNGKIDSYDVDQTQINNNLAPNGVTRQEVHVAQNTEVKDRPKVQLRAWSTPSPVDSQHSSVSNAHMTNNNPYSSRPTMTAITSTTAFENKNSQRSYPQNNGWNDENQFNRVSDRNTNADVATGRQNQNSNGYSDTADLSTNAQLKSGNDFNRGYTNGYMYSSDNPKSAHPNSSGNRGLDTGANKPVEFLQTGTPDNPDKVTNPDSEKAGIPTQESRPSRVPRPVSAVRIQKVKYNVIPPPSANEDSLQAPCGVQSTDKVESGKNGGVQKVEMVPKPPQVFINTTLGDRPQVKQVTQVRFAASVVNGGVNMNTYGKMNVQPLPNKPMIAGITEKKENPPSSTVMRKAKDDSDLMLKNHTEAREECSNSGVRGILKRPGSKLKKAGSTGSVNSMDVKDSIEIARIQMHHHHPKEIPRKKSVRFADLHYPSEEEEEPEQNNENSEANGLNHSSRPISAKVISQSAKAQTQIPRAMSAGHRPQIKHKSTIRPQAAAHIITQNNSPASAMINAQKMTDKKVTVVNNNFMSKVPTSLTPAYTEATVYTVPGVMMNYTKAASGTLPRQEDFNYIGKETNFQMAPGSDTPVQHASTQGPVFDENGMRIDRTPTDEEINFLWEKVRTCLNRPTTQNQNIPVSENQKVSQTPFEPSRQAAVSHQYIDGAALNKIVAANRTQQQTYTPSSGTQSTVKNGEQTYARRYGLLQQRKQQNPNSLNKGPVTSQRQFVTTYNGPVYSNSEPTQNPAAYQAPQDVSESMAAFLTAEQLAQHSMSESQIQNAMDQAQRNQQFIVANKPTQKIPSALSIEEQRLLDSLDRLNERLKITEFPGNLLQESPQPLVPQPDPQQFVYTGSFKGKQPLNSQKRQTESARGGYRGGIKQQIYRYP
ncbi:uncharacterized protein LOC125674127 isoform X4 [Ostrea edulis]|uniref:uncharacterized protein LOC125674127 isoform X4 n=1 Tax=Ostrea edulis TaxID=37623 RepID=UPI0024AE95E4|nr:uncharacterized protein LOC125674127 isoform X4 [Ostrea edulis]